MASPRPEEVDFFSMEKNRTAILFKRQRSSHDIQLVTSKINPDILKTVIANVSTPNGSTQSNSPPLPLCDPILRLNSWSENKTETAPMTIFYNGKVVVVPVSTTKAYDILKLAGTLPYHKESLLSPPNTTDDLSIKRKKSLQKFMKKRAQRL